MTNFSAWPYTLYKGFVIQEVTGKVTKKGTKKSTWLVGMRWKPDDEDEYVEYIHFDFSSLLSAQQIIDYFWEDQLSPEWHKVKNKAKVKSKDEPTYRRVDIGQEDE